MQLLKRPTPKPPDQAESSATDTSLPPRNQAELAAAMVECDRWAILLRPALAQKLPANQMQPALDALRRRTTLIPAGTVLLHRWVYDRSPDEIAPRDLVEVPAAFLDRCTVTNQQFQVFVDQGGYRDRAFWDASVWPRVVEFSDSSGQPGPRYWSHGRFPPALAEHPVIGVSWYEADAYARWVGRRLPTDAEWVKAASWPIPTGDQPLQRKFPWGDIFDPDRANLFQRVATGTAAVHDFSQGDSLGGARQLQGNVWEWTAEAIEIGSRHGALELEQPIKSLRGGAFDTYFDTHRGCQLQSGDSPLARKHNIGFRCCVGACDLADFMEPLADLDPPPFTAASR